MCFLKKKKKQKSGADSDVGVQIDSKEEKKTFSPPKARPSPFSFTVNHPKLYIPHLHNHRSTKHQRRFLNRNKPSAGHSIAAADVTTPLPQSPTSTHHNQPTATRTQPNRHQPNPPPTFRGRNFVTIAATPLHGGSWQLMVFFFFFSSISFLFALLYYFFLLLLSLQMLLFDRDCVGICSWGFWGLWVLLLLAKFYFFICLFIFC